MNIKLYLSAALLMCTVSAAKAVPAKPQPFMHVQPDGDTISVRLVGDEYGHYYMTSDEYVLVNKDGAFYYGEIGTDGNLKPTSMLAHSLGRRTVAEKTLLDITDRSRVWPSLQQLRTENKAKRAVKASDPTSRTADIDLLFDAPFPPKGQPRALVVLVDYPDVPFTVDDPYDYFSRMLNEEGFNLYGGTGCVSEYFRENSNGQFQPQFDLYGPITMDHNRVYYGGNDALGNDKRPHEMAIEACTKLDDIVDFSQYDCDGNGYIDNIYIYYAGKGEASGGGANTVWPHSWYVTAGTYKKYIFDGVSLDRYGCSNEWEYDRPDGVGTFIHEFSHVMGLPDLYSTSYSNCFTPEAWSVLDNGSYNNNGCTPPNYSIFERYALDWMDPYEITGPDSISMLPITENVGCVIKTPKANEFFLLENRQQQGWDTYIPYHGMIIWHIDYDYNAWLSNTVNDVASHQRVDMEEADGTQTAYNRRSDVFPGTKNITSFTDDTNPSMRTWKNQPLELPITNIKEENGVITFLVDGGPVNLYPVTVTASNVTDTTFDISWDRVNDANRYYVSVYRKVKRNGEYIRKYQTGWEQCNVGDTTTVTISGILPETAYYCTVIAAHGKGMADESDELLVTSLPSGINDAITDASVWTEGGVIYVSGAYGADVQVYDLAGRCRVATSIDQTGYATINIGARGVYIVKVGNQVLNVLI